jgi:hypothetical protein
MIALLIRLDGRWGSFRTAAAIVLAVLVSLSLGVFFLGPSATLALACLPEVCSFL